MQDVVLHRRKGRTAPLILSRSSSSVTHMLSGTGIMLDGIVEHRLRQAKSH
jgi:hypothetical protein